MAAIRACENGSLALPEVRRSLAINEEESAKKKGVKPVLFS
tara:strand:+ start:435 stop:557 length:123 start_codon:yes stop_codon:yes gene_type:complete